MCFPKTKVQSDEQISWDHLGIIFEKSSNIAKNKMDGDSDEFGVRSPRHSENSKANKWYLPPVVAHASLQLP